MAAGSAAAGLVLAVVAVAAAGPWESGQRTAEREVAAARTQHRTEPDPSPTVTQAAVPPAAAVLGALGADIPVPTGQGLEDALAPLLDDPALGELRTAAVVDAATGRTVFGAGEDTAAVPASTTKIATAVAALSLLGPDHRIETTTVVDDDRVVLVGGGDPTLSRAALRTLATDTAEELRERDTTTVRLGYDTSLYSGSELTRLGHDDNIAPVTALMLDEGRIDPDTTGHAPREEYPAEAAAERFAGLLADEGVEVTGKVTGTEAAGEADQLAEVSSAPLSTLVERMLTTSDNDIAEALARQAAVAADEPASFAGAGKAVAAALKKLKLPLDDARFADGSGLSLRDRLSAEQLARLLVLASDPAHPELRPVLTGLPVAGFTGTLRSRYDSGNAVIGAGLVRAKTGSLTGVSTLTGTVVDADGRLLTFAFMANGTKDSSEAQTALDRLAAALANCGCRA